MAKVIHVVAGVLYKDNSVLLTSRPNDKRCAGYWEFPGGKIESNETNFEALIRELKEELGIIATSNNLSQLVFLQQAYETVEVYLNVILVQSWLSTPQGIEGQSLYWHNLDTQCTVEPLLPTTQKILTFLKNTDKGK